MKFLQNLHARERKPNLKKRIVNTRPGLKIFAVAISFRIIWVTVLLERFYELASLLCAIKHSSVSANETRVDDAHELKQLLAFSAIMPLSCALSATPWRLNVSASSIRRLSSGVVLLLTSPPTSMRMGITLLYHVVNHPPTLSRGWQGRHGWCSCDPFLRASPGRIRRGLLH